MDFFEVTIISSILIMFPVLLYFIYLIYNYDFNVKANELILDLCLVTSFYLVYRMETLKTSYLIMFIPLLISYLKKRKIPIMFTFLLTVLTHNNYFIISEIIIYLLSKLIKKEKNFVLMFLMINFLATTFFLVNVYSFSTEMIFKILVETIIGFSISLFIIKLFDRFNKLINIYMNLSELKKEAKIQESLFKITHEIKNPIAVCKGYLDMYNVDNIEHSRKYIPIIKSEIERTLILLKDFLSLRKIKLEKEELDLALLFDEAISEMSLYNEARIEYIKKYQDEIYVEGDYNRLKQVIINILKNSAESISTKGFIEIEIISKDDIIIKIKDNGCGMSKETLEKIREPFFTTKSTGTGLGIPLSIEIIETHGWSIEFESTIGIGTIVKIVIPQQKK